MGLIEDVSLVFPEPDRISSIRFTLFLCFGVEIGEEESNKTNILFNHINILEPMSRMGYNTVKMKNENIYMEIPYL